MKRLYDDETLIHTYSSLKKIVIKDDPLFEKLMKRIESETTYLTSPSSARYHGCFEKGLLEHSVSVAMEILKLKKTMAPDLPDSVCVKVALLHDLGKVGEIGNPFYLVNPDYNPNRPMTNYNAPYVYNDKIVEMPHAHRSVYLIQNMGYKLAPEEFQAITSHDGQYIDDNKQYRLKETKLTILLHTADLWSALFKEAE